jgi:hypothetical protein
MGAWISQMNGLKYSISSTPEITVTLSFIDLKDKIILNRVNKAEYCIISSEEENVRIVDHNGKQIYYLSLYDKVKIIMGKPKWYQFIKRIKGEGVWIIEKN